MAIGIHNIGAPKGANKKKKRVGRGPGSGHGKTATRGHKGQKSRSGGRVQPGFEGGQMPLRKRIPKYGFTSRGARFVEQVRLNELNNIDADVIDLAALKAADIISVNALRAKVFLSGEVTKAVKLKGIGATKGARAAIEKAGGSIED